jgi:aspartate/methionine/tyrosine aminotransferase
VKQPNRIVGEYGTTIFEVMSRLAREHEAINLGQGFPEDGGPLDVVEKAATALRSDSNQYPPMLGTPELRRAVAEHDKRFYGLALDWQSQVMVTSGATEAIAVALMALLDAGDEVVVIEPAYDTYIPVIRLAGGVARPVRLAPPDWRLPEAELRAAFSPRTKALIFNSPMNPTGKLFGRAELDLIAELCRAHDRYAVCDEVYEHLVFDGGAHIPLITLPGMAERAIRIGSAGKTFSLTGWKVGYISAAAPLIERMGKCHQFLVFTTPPNLQAAVAYGLGKDDAYFAGLARSMQAKRNHLGKGLARIGFEVLPCGGTYFLSVDIRSVGFNGDDESFCRYITTEARVAAIPVSAFYTQDVPCHFARFCFSKEDATLDRAVDRLARLFAPG